MLISAVELAELLRSDQPPVVADVRWTLGGPPGKPDFEASHIPGAVWVDLETQLAGPPGVGGRHPLPTVAVFEQAMREIGVRQDSLVVAYDAANSQAASRLWWLLTDAGHRDVRVLDGGFAAWRAAGLPTRLRPQYAASARVTSSHTLASGHSWMRRRSVRGLEGRTLPPWSTCALLSATPERTSQSTRLPAISRERSTCPGMSIVHADGRFLPPAEIARLYAEAGGTEGAVLYCGSGITAAHSLLALESAGLTAALYPGSWSDWISDPSRPIATGTDP